MGRQFNRASLTIILSLALMLDAQAETVVETVRQWGLIGPWSLDCALKPDRKNGTVFTYEIVRGDRVMHRRNFGDTKDEAEVVTAEISKDHMLNLRVFFPSLKHTREYGLMMQPDGTLRAMYNRNQQDEYTIKDGKFTATGQPTPAQHRCSGNGARI